MTYFLLTISYLLDVILLIMLIILIIGIFQLSKTLRKENSLIEKLKMTPSLIIDKPENTFDRFAAKDEQGTYLTSYHKHKSTLKLIKRLIAGTFGFLTIKLVIVSLIFFQIPRPSEAAPKYYSVLYQASSFNTFAKGTYTMTQWDNDGVDLQAGQLTGNYISTPLGDGIATNQWKNLSFQADKNYNIRPANPASTIALWNLDDIGKCTISNYTCKTQGVDLTEGLYNTKAYHFDGYRAKVKIEQNVSPTGSFTIAAWINPDVLFLNGSEDQNFIIFAKGYGDYSIKTPYTLKYQLYFGIKEGSLSLIYWPTSNQDHWVMAQNTKYSFAPHRWYHVAGVYDDKNKTLKLYIDGIEQYNVSAKWDGTKINVAPNLKDPLPSWIGGSAYKWMDGEEKTVDVFKGSLDEVMLANTAMNILDIRNLVNTSGEVVFQVRTGDVLPLNGPFFGPGNNQATFFTNPKNNDLGFLTQTKYLQYISYIERPNTNFNPKLNNVIIDYLTVNDPGLKIATTQTNTNTATPSRDLNKEKEGIAIFIKFFKTAPKTESDWLFVNIVAYGQVSQRDLFLEQKALAGFVKFYKKLPSSDLDWRIIKALAYTDKGAQLLKTWLGK
jgi:hypothetical protein